eukprot:scaffold3995_cov133-Skeletonema_menzelii.AAC.2
MEVLSRVRREEVHQHKPPSGCRDFQGRSHVRPMSQRCINSRGWHQQILYATMLQWNGLHMTHR